MAKSRGCRLLSVAAVLAGAVASGAVFAPRAEATAPDWALLSDANGPTVSSNMTYDPQTQNIVLFGGIEPGETPSNQTWLFNGATWSEQTTATAPPAVGANGMVYDAATGYVVDFGGWNGSSGTNQTWLYNGSNWAIQNTPNSPPPLFNVAISYDPALGEIVMFGGFETLNTNTAETWTYNGTTWTEQSPVDSPPSGDGDLSYDPDNGDLYLFSTISDDLSGSFNIWTYNGSNWTELSVPSTPPPSSNPVFEWDPSLSEFILFGGYGLSPCCNVTLNDTWALAGNTWTQLSPADTPPTRYAAGYVYDSQLGQIVVFGGVEIVGSGAEFLSDTWTFGSTGQSVSFSSVPPASPTIGQTYTPQASATSGLAVTTSLDSSSSACSLSAGVVTFTSPGRCVIDANQAGGGQYEPAEAQQSIVVSGTQTISFISPNPEYVGLDASPYTPTATATSGLSVTLTLDASSSGCAMSAGVVSFPATGTCVIDANQTGNDDWSSAAEVQQVFHVVKNPQRISFTSNPPVDATTGATYTPTAGATSGLKVTITLDAGSSGCTLSGGVVTFTTNGDTCVIDANQAGTSYYGPAAQVQEPIPVGPQAQGITFTTEAPDDAVVAGATYMPAATASSALGVTLTLGSTSSGCSFSAGVISFTATGTCVLDANQAGNDVYSAAPEAVQSFAIGKGSQSVSFTTNAPTSRAIGSPKYIPTAEATSGLRASTTLSPTSSGCSLSQGAVKFTATGICVIEARQAGSANYLPSARVSQEIVVVQDAQTVTITSTVPSPAYVANTTYTPTAKSSSGLSVTFELGSGSVGCDILSGVVQFTGVGTCELVTSQLGDAQYSAAPPRTQTIKVVSYDFDQPDAVARTATDVFVVNTSGNSVTMLSAKTGQVIKVLSSASYGFATPDAIAIHGSDVWVTNELNGGVIELSATSGKLIRVIDVYGLREADAIAATKSALWVADSLDNDVVEIDPTNGSVVTTLPSSVYGWNGPIGIAVDVSHVWVLNQSGSVTEMTSDGSFVGILDGADYGFISPVSISSDGKHVWVTNAGNGTVSMINASNHKLVKTITTAAGDFDDPGSVVSDGAHVWVTNTGNDTVSRLTIASDESAKLLSGPAFSFDGVAGIASDGKDAWVTNATGDSVTEVSSAGAFVQLLYG